MPSDLLGSAHHLIWLDNYLRTYRNKFIVHRELPWQIGHTSSVYGLDWRFFSPIPPGWLSDTEASGYQKELQALAIARGIDGESSSQALVSRLLDDVRLPVDWIAREKTLKIATIIGFETPSFHKFARTTFEFLQGMLEGLAQRANAEPEQINLGPPGSKKSKFGS